MLKDKLSITQVMEMKHMGRAAALIFARTRYPQLDSSELAELEGICKLHTPQRKDSSTDYDPHKHTFIGAMWLLGASQKQLGRKYGIAQQTVASHLDRSLREYIDRSAVRLFQPPMAPERLESLYDTFYKMCALDPTWYKELSMLELAAAMSNIPTDTAHSHIDTEELEGDYAELPNATGRIEEQTQTD